MHLLPFAFALLSAAPAAPETELVLSEGLLTAFLQAVTPLERTIEQPIAGQAVQLKIRLTNPSVRVTNAAVKVKIDFQARDASGLLDVSGVASPDLQIVPVPQKGILEARFVRLLVTLPGGVSVPVESLLDPIALPGVWTTDVAFGDKTIVAEARAKEVTPESGRVRVRGTVQLRPKAVSTAKH